MTGPSALDVFALLGELSGDSIFAGRIHKRAADIMADKDDRKDERLTKAYLESEAELVQRTQGKVTQEGIRRQAAAIAAAETDGYPAFRLLFLGVEPQMIALASALVAAYAERGRMHFGPRVVARMLAKSLKDTTWEDVKVDAAHGIAFNAIRMRSMSACAEIVSTLLERWYNMTRMALGDAASRRLFELAYRDVDRVFGFLPMMKSIIGVVPRAALWAEKVQRLHELELETVMQARDIRAADQDLRRQAEELRSTVSELERTRERLEIVGKARSEFIDVVSHQFRTPLSSIRWNGELLADALADGNLSAEFADAVMTVRSRSVYLIETLDRVFATLEIETGTLVIDAKPGFLWEVVQDVYAQMEKDIARAGLKWKFDRPKEQPPAIPIDKVKMGTVLKIVLGNAIMYNKKGGKLTVRVGAAKADGVEYQAVTVSDEGIGIPKEDQERVFEKFYRSKPAVLQVADGTGLGLFIVKHFVEAHRGLVRVDSAGAGKGTTVTIALPLK